MNESYKGSFNNVVRFAKGPVYRKGGNIFDYEGICALPKDISVGEWNYQQNIFLLTQINNHEITSFMASFIMPFGVEHFFFIYDFSHSLCLMRGQIGSVWKNQNIQMLHIKAEYYDDVWHGSCQLVAPNEIQRLKLRLRKT